ncbi:unnamed protein product [Cladocopium goreaui]|uniref:Uncharacterized protein n=1 Tax=Cladocopium goreaui TaxID=2562237 RepID=A0A9P1C2J5_9DINO|nr:unnamed protein product [Cladocopium goreaui]
MSNQVNGKTFFFACCGIKGDWVYLRKALKLESGFRSTRVCHYCDTTEWWKFGSNLRSWNGQLVDPWKTDEPPTPLRTIPGVESPLLIRTDPAHTWPIGVGKEFAASTIFLLCHLDVWPANNMPDKLLGAWEHFQSWRYRTKHTCKLHEFTYKTFKVQSLQQYPVLGGSGSDCIVVCKWLESVVDDPAMLPAFHVDW